MKKAIILVLTLCLLAKVQCQYENILEDMAAALIENGNEADAESILTTISELYQHPVDLNSATESRLNQCGIFTPFQIFGIIQYRSKYGIFFSIYELSVIPGFTQEILEIIAPLLTVSNEQMAIQNNKIEGTSLTNVMAKYPTSSAHTTTENAGSVYTGKNIKIAERLNYQLGADWSFGCAYEKDPGEKWMQENKLEHLSGYLQYNSEHFLRQLIAGNFRVHRGLGLVHGLGFNSRSAGLQLNGFRKSYAKALSSNTEYAYYRGIYADAAWKNYKADVFCSYKPEDMSFYTINKQSDLYEKIRETGLHRTPTELGGVALASQLTTGFSLNRSSYHYNLGISSSWSNMWLTAAGKDSIPELGNLKTRRSNYSAYGVFFGNAYEVYAELAFNQSFNQAVILGTNIKLNPSTSLTFSWRNYNKNYTALSANAFGAGANPENEQGINIGITLIPFPNAGLYLNTDLSNKPESYTMDYSPLRCIYNTLQFTYRWDDGPQIEFRISNKEENLLKIEAGAGNEKKSEQVLSRYRLQVNHSFSEEIKLSTRVELSEFHAKAKTSYGKLVYQQLTYKFKGKHSISYRYLIFSAEHFENRIYTYEPAMRYSFLFPAFYGSGSRNILLASIKIKKWGIIRGKIGCTHYSHRFDTGSSYDLRKGDKVWDAELQIQLNI